MENASWETSKENVLPVKGGRSAKLLESTVSAQFSLKERNNFDEFEKELKNAKIIGADLLDIYVRYFKWARTEFPSSSARAMQVLEKCTSQLSGNSSLRNDLRFVQLWIEYVSYYCINCSSSGMISYGNIIIG